MLPCVMIGAAIALPIMLAWMLAASFWFALALAGRARTIVVIALFILMFALPLMAPLEHGLWRAIVAVACVTPWLKVYDLHYARCLGHPVPRFGEYLGFLVNPCILVHRRLGDEPHPPRNVDAMRVLRGCVVLAFSIPLLQWSFRSADQAAWPFVLEHSVKAALAFAIVYGVFEVIVGLWRLMGFRGRTVVLNFFAARTPAEFWRLYNRHTGQFFLEDVTRPLQRRTGIAAATMAAFAASGVAHEYLAFVAIGRIQFLQLSFFLIQGLAVVLTQRMRPRGPAAYVGVALTAAFNLATSLLFFASADQFVDWYSGETVMAP
jgi:hypothetical protein